MKAWTFSQLAFHSRGLVPGGSGGKDNLCKPLLVGASVQSNYNECNKGAFVYIPQSISGQIKCRIEAQRREWASLGASGKQPGGNVIWRLQSKGRLPFSGAHSSCPVARLCLIALLPGPSWRIVVGALFQTGASTPFHADRCHSLSQVREHTTHVELGIVKAISETVRQSPKCALQMQSEMDASTA